jgi:hypothetical protein
MASLPGQQKLTVIPLTLADACAVVDRLHRHHKKPQGHKWSHCVIDEAGAPRGVAVVGRPVARCFDDGFTVEVTRVATDGTPNACSALYGAAWQKARVDHWRAITYTQDGESGASLRAAGWTPVAELSPRKGWDTPSRRRGDRGTDGVARILWEQRRKDAPPLPSIRALRDELRDEIECAVCPRMIPLALTRGRPRRYCSRACQQRAYRLRLAA